MPANVHICPDFGYAKSSTSPSRGYVDFYINSEHNIGVELNRDGHKLESHVARFGIQGIYASLKLKSWIVVDFRQSSPTGASLARQNCIFVVFSKDFATATIKEVGTEDVVVHLRQ